MIPVVNLEAFIGGSDAERRAIAGTVDTTCRTIGFLVVDGHGVPRPIVDAAWEAARAFFALPLEEKLKTKSADPGCPRGYFPLEEETLAQTRGERSAPDPKEAFSSGPPHPPAGHGAAHHFEFFYGTNLWPAAMPEFAAAWLDYYRAMEVLGAKIMTLLATALGQNGDYFAPFHSRHISALRGINYPSAAECVQRAGAHSDYGSVTILKADPVVGGLEVQAPNAEWLPVPSVVDGFIVNIGDLMAHWTNDRWVSTLHRVVTPKGKPALRRQSLAYFMNPNYDAEIRVLPNCGGDDRTVIAGDYLIDKFRSAFKAA